MNPANEPRTYRGRQPRSFFLVETGAFCGREQLPPRRVPRFAADGVIHFGADSTIIGPWKPWRVPHRFVRRVVLLRDGREVTE